MSFYRNRKTGEYECDFRPTKAMVAAGVARLHLSLKTKRKAEAASRDAALSKLIKQGHWPLVAEVRAGRLPVETVERCHLDDVPFATLYSAVPDESAAPAVAAWPTVAEAVDGYVAWLRAHPKKEEVTADTAASQLKHFVAAVGADTPLDAVTSVGAALFQADIVKRFSVNSATNYVRRAAAVFRWAQADEVKRARDARPPRLPRHLHVPFDADTLPTGKTRRERFLTKEESVRLIAATPGPLLFPVAVGLLAGLRVEEMLHLRPGVDVQLERDMIVVQAREGEPPHGWRPKGSKRRQNQGRREIPIVSSLRPVAERHVERYASERYMTPGAVRKDLPLNGQTFRDAFARVVRDAELSYGRGEVDGVTYHTLRHSFATHLVMQDVNPYRVAKLMGNSLKQIEETYGHLAPADNRRAVETLSGLVSLPEVE